MTTPNTEVLSFQIAKQTFAAEINVVREIRGWTAPTKLPHSPEYVQGVINLRGTILPILDLGMRLGLDASADEDIVRPVIIVTQDGNDTIGLKVDAVNDILTLPSSEISQAPELLRKNPSALGISGVFLTEDDMVRILDLPWILHGDLEGALDAV